MKNLEEIKNQIGDYAKDTRLNLAAVLKEDPASNLKSNQIYAVALACCYAVKNQDLTQAIINEAGNIISDSEILAAKSAAAIMAMNNIYYRFTHLVNDDEYSKMPAKLRMNVIANSGVDRGDFELYCLAVSAINGCGLCIESHARQLENSHFTKNDIWHAVRIAAVINSVALSLMIA